MHVDCDKSRCDHPSHNADERLEDQQDAAVHIECGESDDDHADTAYARSDTDDDDHVEAAFTRSDTEGLAEVEAIVARGEVAEWLGVSR